MKKLTKCPTEENQYSGHVSLTLDELARIEVGVTKLIVLGRTKERKIVSAPIIEQWMIDGCVLHRKGADQYVLMPFSNTLAPAEEEVA